MKRWLLVPLILAASSSIAQPIADRSMAELRAEATQSEADAVRLTKAAETARGEAAKLAGKRLAAAAAIAAAEARISEADAMLGARQALVEASSARLAAKQAPIAALVAGVVNLGRRPPLVSLAADRDLSQMVRMRALLDVAVPRIRAQSAALSVELAANRRLVDRARSARSALAAARASLKQRQQQFAALEGQSLDQAASFEAGADDRMLAASEGVSSLGSERERERAANRLAGELAAYPAAPRRPFAPESRASAAPFALVLPVDAPVIEGLGQVSISGIRSRGTTFATRAGDLVLVPADGALVFAGPYRRHDGIAIIDHGHGWMSLIVGVRTTLPKGARLIRGAPLGKALGQVSVELSTNGRPVSAILLAGSS